MPYERRAMELMKVGRDKRAFKYVKARVCVQIGYIFIDFD
jgi:hypothetical protein